MNNINKKLKNIIICIAVLLFVLPLVFPQNISFADPLPYTDEYHPINMYVNRKKVNDIAFTIKGNVYIKLSTLKAYGDTSKLKFDTSSGKVSFNVADLDINMGSEEASAFIKANAGECYIPIKNFKDENGVNSDYVSIGSVAQLAKFSWSYSNHALFITQYSSAGNLATTNILNGSAASLHNQSVAELSSGSKVFIIDESKSFYKVQAADGSSFFVNKTDVKKVDDPSQLADYEYIPTQKDHFSSKINLCFLNLADGATRTPLPPENEHGIDVLSPCWLHQVVNGNGDVKTICDYGYVQLAHDMGYKVWVMANNCFVSKGSSDFTTKVMESEKLSDKVIAKYLFYTCLCNADGINIDYEDLRKSDRDSFSAFMSKLGYYCDELGLTLAVDTSTPESYNTMYNWQSLASSCDYLIPMTYVEHMGNSVGSISSYGWYSNRINKLINEEGVPKEQILMGVPFFSRIYYLNSSGSISSSSTITMKSLRSRIESLKVTPVWNIEAQQFIAEYPSTDKTVKVWLEDEHSIAARINYVLESDIAGTACWALEQEYDGILDIFGAIYKDGVDPSVFYKSEY